MITNIKKANQLRIRDKTHTLDMSDLRPNNPDSIVLHSTRTYKTFEEVLACHKKRGFAGVGYHFFIDSSGEIYRSRPEIVEGAHALGFNTHSIGISFFSNDGTLESRAIDSGKKLIENLDASYRGIRIISHLQAQIEYINMLLLRNGYGMQFNYSDEMLREEEFQALKRQIDTFTGSISTEQNEKIKRQLKALKNCPGILFKEFRRIQ